ncbi:SMC-Scp complex subunit ScpB [Candidatus Fermentibacterales bacterium]|nr:SMC-Scp complex subunit ScpB [Candidatus Fermentibacterales bacterium]
MLSRLTREIEALLLATDRPIGLEALCDLTGSGAESVEEALEELRQEYADRNHAIAVVEHAGGYRLATDPDLGDVVAQLFEGRRPGRLTRAALETLAVIAYAQPCTRATIESIRGVNSDSAIRTLLERDLIEISGRMDAVGRPLLYSTTATFLSYFGLRDLDHLPRSREISSMLRPGELFDALSEHEAEDPVGEAEEGCPEARES